MPLLDDVLPTCDWHETHAIELPCAPERALDAVWNLPVGSDPVVRLLLRARGLSADRTLGELLSGGRGFNVVARSHTEVVAAASGTPWRPRGGLRPLDEAGPGTLRVAIDIRAEPVGALSRLSTETRIAAVDDDARRAFGRYWRVVGPFSGLIRRRWLEAAKRAVS